MPQGTAAKQEVSSDLRQSEGKDTGPGYHEMLLSNSEMKQDQETGIKSNS